MKLEDQVCSLELAMRLKELGAKQDSYWVWVHPFRAKDLEHFYEVDNKLWKLLPRQSMAPTKLIRHHLAAYTVAELGETLPVRVTSEKNNANEFLVRSEDAIHLTWANTEADARAKMLIWLIKKGLIKEKRGDV